MSAGQDDWDDSTMDAVALVSAVIADDVVGSGAILRNCDKGTVLVVLAKLVAAAVNDNAAGIGVCADPECFRAWCQEAVTRP